MKNRAIDDDTFWLNYLFCRFIELNIFVHVWMLQVGV